MRFTLMAFLLSVSGAALAEPLCHPRLLDQNISYDKALDACRSEGQAQGREHLISYLEERNQICKILNQNDTASEGYRSCFREILQVSSSTLACLTSPQRQLEAAEFTRQDSDLVIHENGAAEVPAAVQELFLRLAKAAETSFPNPRIALHWEILGYKDTFANAQAGADGRIIASTALWNGANPFTMDEIAGILAHEIAHVMEMHNLEFGCKTLEWMDADLSLVEAYEYFRQDFNILSERAQSRNRISQKNEFAADMKATEILKAAGLDPQFMALALRKIDSMSVKGGIPSGSHPDLEDRIARVSSVK